MTSKTPLNPSRRSLMTTAGVTVAAGAAFQAIGTGALAQPAKGTVKAIGFDAFTIFNPFSVDAVIEEKFPGKRHATGERVAHAHLRILLAADAEPNLCRLLAGS